MELTQNSISNTLSLDEALTRLAASDAVDGLALFGSRTTIHSNPISDYDLLILVAQPPVSIFQMLTHIAGRMADVVFVDTQTADRVLSSHEPVAPASEDGMFLLKMRQAQIVYDASGRLGRVQQLVRSDGQPAAWLQPSTYPAVYAAWFWQNHGLIHIRRMLGSGDPDYLTAADLMLLSALGQVCRAYYCTRNLPWQGEKAAVRYLQEHDPGYLVLLRECLAAVDRAQKLSLYEQLVVRTVAPVGPIWTPGITAVFLRDPVQHSTHLDTALEYWDFLLGSNSGKN